MLTAIARPIRRLFQNREGFGALELGLALPFLLLTALGMMDASRMIATKIDYEQAAQRATDLALAKRPNSTNGSYLKTEAASAAGLTTSKVSVDIFLECSGTRQSNFNSSCTGGATPARFVSVSIANNVDTNFDWSSLNGLIGFTAFPRSIKVTGDSLVRFQ